MKHGKLLKAAAALAVFTAMGATLAACGGQGHNLTKHDAVDSTCKQEGNVEYWDCSHCDKLFADAEGKQEIKDIAVAKKPHSIGDDNFHKAVPSDCEHDGTLPYWECDSCHGKFSDKGGTKELTDIVDPAAHTPASHNKVEPTFTTAGKKAYWDCTVCGKVFLTEEADTPVEESDLVIPALGEETVEVAVTVKDKTGATVSDADTLSAIKVKLELQNALFEYAYGVEGGIAISQGKLDLAKIGTGVYKVTAEGYYNTTLTVTKGTPTAELILEEVEYVGHNPHTDHPEYLTFENVGGEHRAVFNTPFGKNGNDAVYIDISDDALTGNQSFMAEFTVRAAYLNTDWMSRFYIAVANGTGSAQIGYGFVFGNDDDKLIMTDMKADYAFGGIDNEYKLNGKDNRYNSADMIKALTSANGLHLRVLRNGRTVTFLAKTETGWDAFRTLTLAGDYDARLAFAVTANETITFSNVSCGEYVAPTYNADSIVLAHYVKGEKIYTLAGEETTLAALTISKLESYSLTLKAGETPIAKDTNVKFVNADVGSFDATVGNGGVVSLNGKVYVGLTYTVSIEGYVWEYTFTVAGEEAVIDSVSGEYSQATQVVLDRTHEGGGWAEGGSLDGTDGEAIVFTATFPTKTQVVMKTTDTLKNAEVYTLTFRIASQDLVTDWAGNRIGFRVTDANGADQYCGFFLYPLGSYNGQTNVVYIGNLTGDLNLNRVGDGNAPAADFILVNAISLTDFAGGLDFKIEYNMGVATLFVKSENVWTKLFESNVSGNPQVAFAAANSTFTYTNVAVQVLTPEKLDSVALTLKDQNGNLIAAGKTVTLTGKKGDTATGTVGENGVVTLTGGNKVYNLVDYTVKLESSTSELVIRFNGATAELIGFLMPQYIDSVELTLKAGTAPVAEGKRVTLISDLGTVETTVGAGGVVTLTGDKKVYDLVTYSVKVEGYALRYEIVFDGATAELTTLEAVTWEYTKAEDATEWKAADSIDNLTVTKDGEGFTVAVAWENSSWKRGGVNINTGDALGDSTHYIVRFTITANLTGGWTDRFGIRLVASDGSDDIVGFNIWDKGGDGICFTSLNQNCDVGDRNPDSRSILTAAMFAEGLDIQIVRNGNKATLSAKINGKWQEIFSVDLAEGSAQLGFYAAGGTYTYSDISIAVIPDTFEG